MINPVEELLQEGLALHNAGNLGEAALRYNQLLNLNPFNPQLLYLLGDIAVRQRCNGLAINLLNTSLGMDPRPEGFTALGCAYRAENMYAQAIAAWESGIKLGASSEMFNNIASVYSDHGQPELAMKYILQAEAMGCSSPNLMWNKALALLTNRNWPEAWKLSENRFHADVQTCSTRRHFAPLWDGTPGLRIAVHGEQGVGDEIMFLSQLADLLKVCPDTVIEVEPRLMDLVERSFGIPVYGNEQAMAAHEKPFDAQVALGSLGAFFRQADSDFPGTPYLKADPERIEYWRRQFAMQGPRPFIGVAWQGGAKETRITQRSLSPKNLQFCKRGTAISLQYGPHAQAQAQENGFIYYPESNGADLNEMAAMVAACDAVVTVAQTLVHLSGAIGTPCHVLTPLYSSWRYGLQDTMPWYGCVKLHRQKTDGDWGYPLAEAKKEVDALYRSLHDANQ